MNHNEIASQYRQLGTRGSHPVGLVVKMYATILEDFRRAMISVDENDIEGRTASLNHALKIIAELQSVLDHVRGKEVARLLNGFYDVTRMLIVEANIHSDRSRIQRVVDLYLPLYNAWRHVEQEAHMGKLQLEDTSGDNLHSSQALATNKIVPANESSEAADSDSPRAQWNA